MHRIEGIRGTVAQRCYQRQLDLAVHDVRTRRRTRRDSCHAFRCHAFLP
jgi:hypothetical protein